MDSSLGLRFHLLGHLFVFASNDHTTCFWVRECPSNAASIFAPDGAKLATAALDDDADGNQYDGDGALVVPGCRECGRSTSIRGTAECL
jgi:hypothetical protein